ncbi:NAD-dependent protein deacylase [Lactobacillus isalae]|uniref:NAD-dependent protein deacylase n=1 Tax=Lactobacillus isalae TaxID=2993455 RepID=UPI0024A8D55F|nr:NAD-dependent protein deacylase [Lactobacillus isalae]
MDLDKQIAALQSNLNDAHHVTYLTGAGVSTPSHIPDYRSKNGIYNGISENPEQILSEDTLFHEPTKFHHFIMENMYFPKAKPNIIHEKIAASCNKNGTLITQNVDGLDKKAGNKHVIEFHGDLYNIFCTKCHEQISYEEYKKSFIHEKDNGLIRPGIVLYGEPINENVLVESVENIQNSDLVIIAGTSFVVYPFAQLLAYRQPDAKVWIVNNTPVPAPKAVPTIIANAEKVFDKLYI